MKQIKLKHPHRLCIPRTPPLSVTQPKIYIGHCPADKLPFKKGDYVDSPIGAFVVEYRSVGWSKGWLLPGGGEVSHNRNPTVGYYTKDGDLIQVDVNNCKLIQGVGSKYENLLIAYKELSHEAG